MPLAYQFIYLVNVLATLALGFFIFYRDIRNLVNLLFFCFSVSLAGWVFTLYLYYHEYFIRYILFIGRLNFVFTIAVALFFFLFVYYFPIKVITISRWILILMFIESIVLSFFTFFSNFISVNEIGVLSGHRATIFGPAYPVFIVHFVFYTLGACLLLFYKIRFLDKTYRNQLIYFVLGIIIALFFGTTTNIIIPFVFNNFTAQNFGSISTFWVVFFTTYSIIKHKLLNIRIFATQTFVVLFTLAFLVPIIYADSIFRLILDLFLFVFVVLIGLLLISSVQKDFKQKEQLTELAYSLEKANLRLQELDRQKTEFLSIAAHQLRTPLSILKGYIELIKDEGYGKPTKGIVKVLDDMDISNEHLIKLVDEFLNISHIEQDRIKFVFAVGNIWEIIEKVVKELELKAQEKNINIIIKKVGTLLPVEMDGEKIHHVIFNFVDNALKYTDDGGTVIVSAENEDGGVTVRVQDSGLGFNKVDEANFFQKFYRGANVKDIDVNGTGLGLYVCRKFIEAHGGKVWAHSSGPGKGSEFCFWIPLKLPKTK